MKLSDSLVGAVCGAFGIWMYLASRGFPAAPGMTFGSALFPRILAVGFVICGLLLIAQQAFSSARDAWAVRPPWARDVPSAIRFALVPLGIVFYIIASPWLGMVLASVILLASYFALLHVRLRVAVPVAVLAPLGIYLIFSRVLLVPLPQGLLQGTGL